MEKVMDVSGLEAPKPMERILDALADMEPGDYLRVRLHREPVPLYGMLQTMGYRWLTRMRMESSFEIFIWAAGDEAPAPVRELASERRQRGP